MAAKSIAELQAQIEDAIGESLNGDVMEFIQQKLVEHAEADVYSQYVPKMYVRRGSLLDKDKYLIETGENMHLVITPVQEFNPIIYVNGKQSRSKNSGEQLAGLINYGDGYGGYHYEFPDEDVFGNPNYAPRPFLDNTKEELASGELADSLWASLKKHGYNVK